MADLVYSVITSLDGYVADERGNFDWAAPDEEVHAFVNDLERPVGTYLYGRALYEVMVYWAEAPTEGDHPAVMKDYAAIWQAADKIVYSSTLPAVSSDKTVLVRELNLDGVRDLKAAAASNISIGGPHLAAHAIRAGLVDHYQLFLHPIIVGGGTRALPDEALIGLELVDHRRFSSGVVHLHYAARR